LKRPSRKLREGLFSVLGATPSPTLPQRERESERVFLFFPGTLSLGGGQGGGRRLSKKKN